MLILLILPLVSTVAVSRSTGQAEEVVSAAVPADLDQSLRSAFSGLGAMVRIALANVPHGPTVGEPSDDDLGSEGATDVSLSFHTRSSFEALAERSSPSGGAEATVSDGTTAGDGATDDGAAGDGAAGDGMDPEETIDPEMARLRDRIRKALTIYYARPTNSGERSPWGIMHAIVAFGVDTQILRGGPNGPPVTGVGWLCYNGRGRGQQLFYPSGDRFGLHKGPGVQGHDGQLLAILAQSHVMVDYPIRVAGKQFTVADLVEYEKGNCLSGTELTFTLIGLVHYLDTDATWKNERGQVWSIQRLIREELARPIRGAPCGGSHRLMGLSYAVAKRARRGEPMVGQFRRAKIYLRDYQRYTFGLQNRDGSFSTEWFRGRGNRADEDRKLQTTGHVLEWMVFSLPDEERTDPRIVRAVSFTTDLLLQEQNRDWKIGPLGHALRALVLYNTLVFSGTSDDFRMPRRPVRQVLSNRR
ncbi:MAG: hypothetical protein ACC645_11225 [Pirellulales bacterium]